MAKTKKDAAGFECLVNISHDGVLYLPGEAIELTDDQAAPLLETNAIKRTGGEATVVASGEGAQATS